MKRFWTTGSRTLVPLEELRLLTMSPIYEARAREDLVVFARQTGPTEITYAWFELDPVATAISACGLCVRETVAKYCAFLKRREAVSPLTAVSPEHAKAQVLEVLWACERAGRYAPPEFPMVIALLDGVSPAEGPTDAASEGAATTDKA